MKFKIKFLSLLLFALAIAGCSNASAPKPLYYWDGEYSAALYGYLTDEYDAYEQIGKLENSLQKIYEQNAAVPPGLYAHLGLLYSNLGNDSRAKSYFDKEVQTFPEARAYIAFLLSQKDKKDGK